MSKKLNDYVSYIYALYDNGFIVGLSETEEGMKVLMKRYIDHYIDLFSGKTLERRPGCVEGFEDVEFCVYGGSCLLDGNFSHIIGVRMAVLDTILGSPLR